MLDGMNSTLFRSTGIAACPITLDCDVLQADGGTRTAAITGAYVALADAMETLQRRRAIASSPLHGQVAAGSDAALLRMLDRLNSNQRLNIGVIRLSIFSYDTITRFILPYPQSFAFNRIINTRYRIVVRHDVVPLHHERYYHFVLHSFVVTDS